MKFPSGTLHNLQNRPIWRINLKFENYLRSLKDCVKQRDAAQGLVTRKTTVALVSRVRFFQKESLFIDYKCFSLLFSNDFNSCSPTFLY